jgi:uncharacterized protein YecT (DUF1311 family)
MLKIIILTAILTFNFCSYSQTIKKVVELENKYQECLDSGNGMKKCSMDFYSTSDSLLNVAYKNLKIKLNTTEQTNLKIEQQKWLKKRDAYFKKAFLEAKTENSGDTESSDFQMFYFDKKSTYVIERVKELIKRRNKIK